MFFNNQDPKDTAAEFARIRTELYEKRRNANLKILSDELRCLESKIRFIKSVMMERIDIFHKSRAQIIEQLQDQQYPTFNGTFEVYLGLRVSDFTTEKVSDLQRKIAKNKGAVEMLRNTTADTIWGAELNSRYITGQ